MANPKILHHNIIARAASLVASSTAAGTSVLNLGDGRPYTWWRPSAAPASIEVDAGVATEADYLYIPAHTLDSDLWDVSLYAADLPFSGMQLLTQPEDFSNAEWVKVASTVTANAAVAPNGTATADKLIPDSAIAFGSAAVYDQLTKAAVAKTYAFSVYAQAAGFNRARVLLREAATGANFADVTVSLVDGSIVSAAAAAGTFTAAAAIVSPMLAGGYFRITLICTTSTETSIRAYVFAYDSVASQGDGVNGIFIWGAMLNEGAVPAPYIPQAPLTSTDRWISEPALCHTNRVPNPANLSVGTVASNLAVTANADWAPDGTMTAALLVDSNNVAEGYLDVRAVELHPDDVGHTGSVYFKKTQGDVNYKRVAIFRTAGVTTRSVVIIFDTNTGAVTGTSGGSALTYGVEDAGDYWWVWLVFGQDTAAFPENRSVYMRISPAYNSTGSGPSDVTATGQAIVWGAKLEKTQGRPAPYRANAPIFLPFTSTRKRYWLLRANRKTGSAFASLACVYVGKALELPTGLPQGTDLAGRRAQGASNRNENGQPLGRVIDFEDHPIRIRLERVSWAWMRGVFTPAWRRGLDAEPCGFIWDHESHVEDVYHGTLDTDFKSPHYSGRTCDLEIEFKGVVT